jgi:hypothetical protein
MPVTAVTLLTLSLGGCADLSKARIDANEASTIGSLRTILSAEYVYSSFNGGAYGSLECLAAPKGCNQADPGQPHLNQALAAAGERSGYRLEFHAGPSSPAAAGRPPGSSLETFAVLATPVTPGSTGTRRFCVDNRGDVCTLDAAATIAGGQCPAACVVLR